VSIDRRRIARLVGIAEGEQQRAQAQVQAAAARVRAVDDQRASALSGAASLAANSVPLGLRGHLVSVGARHLHQLADDKSELVDALDEERRALEEATGKVRSLERLGQRLDEAERLRTQRRAAADLQDLVGVDAARDRRTT
jgi:hypothetical protein